jgi:hypothetical protein
MILFELVMNFPSFSNFLEFELKGLILVVPGLSLPTETDRWDQSPHQQPRGADRVKMVDWEEDFTAGEVVGDGGDV